MANVNSTETYEDQLRDTLYRNWVKAGLAPKYLKEGLETFVDNIIKDLQTLFLSDICNTLGVVNAKCTVCTTANVLPCPIFGICNLSRKGGKCNYHVPNNAKLVNSKCQKNICDRLYEKIRLLHRFQPPSWKNTDAQQWCTNHWEIAKCFLSPTGYEDKASIQDTDCTGILNIAINCLHVQKYLDVYIDPHNDVLSKIIKIRNNVVHSATMALTEDELEEYIGLMITLLGDKKILVNDPNAQNDIVKLKQLKECTFCITTKDETEIRDEAVYAAKQREQDDYLGRKKELQLGLCQMYDKHFSQIPISPLLECVKEDLDDVFVELFICDDLLHENKVNERTTTDQGIRVKTLNEIFYKTECSQICKHIYVVGDAGMGKTTWCMKLLNTWVSACNKKRQVSSVHIALTDDETMILYFDVVLFVALRHGLRDENIREMIKHQLFEEHSNLDMFTSEVLEKEPGKCLIIVDGLDEWSPPENVKHHSSLQHPQLPGRKCLNGCPCVTTTRPWKLEGLRLANEHIDRAVRIKGIEDARQLAENVIQARAVYTSKRQDSNIADQRNIEHFQNSLSELSFNPISVWTELDFLQIPLILLLVVCIWLDEEKIESTWAGNFTLLLECMIKRAEGDTQSGRPGRLCQIVNLNSIKKQWEEKSKHNLPECIQKKSFVKYSGLILRLAKLAFETLISSKNEHRLVFTESTLANFFSEIELEVAVKIGILSQSQVVGKTLTKECSVSFLHKTIQEYFAAVFLCSNLPDNHAALHTFLLYCHDLDHVYSVGNVILFVFGLNSRVASEISKHIAHLGLQDTHNVNNSQKLSEKCLHEFQVCSGSENNRIKVCPLYGASLSYSQEGEMKLKMLKTNWYVDLYKDTSQDKTLEAIHNTAKWLPKLILECLQPDPRKTTQVKRTTKLLIENPMQSKESDDNEIDLRYFSKLTEVSLCNLSSFIIKLPQYLKNILIVEAFNCSITIKGNSLLGFVRNTIKENMCVDNVCKDTLNCKISSVLFMKCKLCKLQIDESDDKKYVFVDKLQIERCETCEFKIGNSCHQTKQMKNNVIAIGRILITESHNSILMLTDYCKIDIVKFKSCLECKIVYRVNNLASHRSETTTSSNHNLYHTNMLLFDHCDACELEVFSLDTVSPAVINSIKQRSDKIENNVRLYMVEFRNCKWCNFSSSSDVLASYPTLVIQLLAINYNNDQHSFNFSIESVNNFTKLNIASLDNILSEQIEFYDIPQTINPIKGITELTLENCAEETYETLTQVLKCLEFLEKLTLSTCTESSLVQFPNKNTKHQDIQETVVNAISQLDQLKHLALVGLSLEAYEAMADILSSTFRLESLHISNIYTTIPELFIDSIRYQSKLKQLKFDIMPDICQRKLIDILKSLTKLETLSIPISGSVILSTQHVLKADNEALEESLKSKTSKTRLGLAELSTHRDGGLVHSTKHVSYLKQIQLKGITTAGSESLNEWLPSMTRLETLDISANYDCVLSKCFIDSTKHLSNLKHLKLNGLTTEESGFLAKCLPSLTRLESMEISSRHNCVISKVFVSKENISSCKHVQLKQLPSDESIADYSYSMTRLHTLDIFTNFDCYLSEVLTYSLTQAANLKHKSPSNDQSLDSFTQIETLDIFTNCVLSKVLIHSPKHFSHLKRISLLHLSAEEGEYLTESFPVMTMVETLDISSHNNINLLNVLMHTKYLLNLKHLKLNGLTTAESGFLAKCLPSLTRLETMEISSRHDCVIARVFVHKGYTSSYKHIQIQPMPSEKSTADNCYSITRLQTINVDIFDACVLSQLLMESLKQAANLKHESLSNAKRLPPSTQLETLDIYTNVVLSKVLIHSSKHLSSFKRISLRRLSTEEGNYLLESLPDMTRLETLDLSFSGEDNKAFSGNLHTTPRLQTLGFSSILVTTLSMELMSSLKHLKNLKCLLLNGLNTEASEALADSLHAITRIESLDISAAYDYLLSKKLMSSIKHLTNLQHLRLTGLDIEASETLADSLRTLMKIQTLDIYPKHENILSKELISSIKHYTNLRHLCFIGINHDASEALANSLSAITRIQKLEIATSCDSLLSNEFMFSITHLANLQDLCLTGLDREASEALAYSLPTLTRIQTLEISAAYDSSLSNTLMSSIKHLTNLQHLRLTCLDREASAALGDSLPTLTRIQTLDISFLEHHTSSQNCVQSTTHLTKLKQLRLAGLTTDGIVVLIAGLPYMIELEKLEISIDDLCIVNDALIDSLPVTNGPLSVEIESNNALLSGRLKQYITSKSRFQIVAYSPFYIRLTTTNHFKC